MKRATVRGGIHLSAKNSTSLGSLQFREYTPPGEMAEKVDPEGRSRLSAGTLLLQLYSVFKLEFEILVAGLVYFVFKFILSIHLGQLERYTQE